MRNSTVLLIVLGVACLALVGLFDAPALIPVAAVLFRVAWKQADQDELLRLFA